MTAEEQKALARREKIGIARTLINFYPEKYGNPYKEMELLATKTLGQLKKEYKKVTGQEWIYRPDMPFPWEVKAPWKENNGQ